MMGWNMGGAGAGVFGILGFLLMLAIFVLVVWGLILLARSLWGQARLPAGKETPESPLEIVKRRYARGEIDRQEFEAKIRDLGG